MAFALDLRFDLKTLSDEALAARLEAAFAEREAIRPPLLELANDRYRGFVRHPAVYRLNLFLDGLTTFEIAFLWLAPFLISRRLRQWLLANPEARIYLTNCEILDLHDEVARRVTARRGVAA